MYYLLFGRTLTLQNLRSQLFPISRFWAYDNLCTNSLSMLLSSAFFCHIQYFLSNLGFRFPSGGQCVFFSTVTERVGQCTNIYRLGGGDLVKLQLSLEQIDGLLRVVAGTGSLRIWLILLFSFFFSPRMGHLVSRQQSTSTSQSILDTPYGRRSNLDTCLDRPLCLSDHHYSLTSPSPVFSKVHFFDHLLSLSVHFLAIYVFLFSHSAS